MGERKYNYKLSLETDGAFGRIKDTILLQKRVLRGRVSWCYWVWSDIEKRFKNVAKQGIYCEEKTLQDIIKRIENDGSYIKRKVLKVENLKNLGVRRRMNLKKRK